MLFFCQGAGDLAPARGEGSSEWDGANGGRSRLWASAGNHQRLGEPGQAARLADSARPSSGASPAVAPGPAPGGHRSAQDTQRLSRSDELTLCPVDPRSGATALVSEVRCGRFGVDGGTLFASVGFDAAKTGTASLRTKSSNGAEMAGRRIPGHSSVGTAIQGANPLVGRDGITFGP